MGRFLLNKVQLMKNFTIAFAFFSLTQLLLKKKTGYWTTAGVNREARGIVMNER